MTRHVFYDSAGRLTHFEDWGEQSPGVGYHPLDWDQNHLPVAEAFGQQDVDGLYAPLPAPGKPRQLVARPKMPLKIPGRSIRTSGGDCLEIPEALVGGRMVVRYLDCGKPCAANIGNIELGTKLEFNRPGRYEIRIFKFPYRDFKGVVHAAD